MRAWPVVSFLIALPLAGLFSGCSGEVSVDQDFVNLFVELRLAEVTYGKEAPSARLVRQEALKAAGYTREQFLAKADRILDDERQWVPFQKAVKDRLDSLLEAPKPMAATSPDTSKAAVKKKMMDALGTMPARKGGGGR